MDGTIYDIVKVSKVWHVCRLRPTTIERWELTSLGYKTRAEAYTEMHGQRFSIREALQLIKSDIN